MSSFRVCSANTLSSGSSSDRKPNTPEADVKPGMIKGSSLDLEKDSKTGSETVDARRCRKWFKKRELMGMRFCGDGVVDDARKLSPGKCCHVTKAHQTGESRRLWAKPLQVALNDARLLKSKAGAKKSRWSRNQTLKTVGKNIL
jgi:hypothetical protein